jgi:hypothetical protein
MAEIKRIFITGAPGSGWSSADRAVRDAFNPICDNSDINADRDWNGHLGAYWNPGNEPGYDWILNFEDYSREHIIETLDSVYSPIPEGQEIIVRTHKSHLFSYHLDKIHNLFPEAAILTVTQEPHKCFVWWMECGGHDTVFDNYYYYKRDYTAIWNEIVNQNNAINEFNQKHNLTPEYLNLDFFRKYFREPSDMLKEKDKEKIHPDRVDSLIGRGVVGTGLSNTTKVSLLFDPKIFNWE